MTQILGKSPLSSSRSENNKMVRLGWISTLLDRTPLGWKQLKHSKSRMLVAVAGIAFADLLMFAQLGIQAALFDSNTRLQNHIEADIILLNRQAQYSSLLLTIARRRLFQAQDVPGVALVNALYTGDITWRNPQTRRQTNLTLIGQSLDYPGLDLVQDPFLLDQLKQPNTVLFDTLSRGDYQEVIAQIQAGQIVSTEIDRNTVKVVGTFELGASFASDGTLLTSQETFLRLFPRRDPGQVSLGLVQVKEGYDISQVVRLLRERLSEEVKVLTKDEFVAFERAYWNEVSPIGIVFGFGTIMAFAVGIVIVYQILSTDVNQHLAEYATFKAMGYRDRYLLLIVFEEALILAVLGFIPGWGLAVLQYRAVAQAASLPIRMTGSRLLFVFVSTVVMCCFSGAIATRKLHSADPADIF
jgi:putative ABC transport system permease protein